MLQLIRRSLPQNAKTSLRDSTPLSLFLLFSSLNASCPKPLSTLPIQPAETEAPNSSFTISYLVNSCGLSLKSAISASQKVQLKSAEKPDDVLTWFRNHGFNETQIRNIIVKWPRSLLFKPDKTLLPKLQYFKDLGIPSQMVVKAISSSPRLLTHSLHNQIIPYVDFIKTYIHSNEDIITSVDRISRFLVSDFRELMGSNIKILREHGVPEISVGKLLAEQPSTLMASSDRFHEIISIVEEVGFDPSVKNFILAIRVVSSLTRSNLEEKMNVYRSLGWSQEELLFAFKLQPILLWISQKKIKRSMSFFVNEMDWKPSDLARRPDFLIFSLERRIIPRFSVVQILLLKGVLPKDFTMSRALRISDEAFTEKFLIKYQDDIPEILTIYQGKMRNSKPEESKARSCKVSSISWWQLLVSMHKESRGRKSKRLSSARV